MKYLLTVPDDLDGYEHEPGDFQRALIGLLDTWLGDYYVLLEVTQDTYAHAQPAELERIREDRDRLSAIVSRIDSLVERMYLPLEFSHFQSDLSRILLDARQAL